MFGCVWDLELVLFKVDGFGLWGGWGGMKWVCGVGLRIGLLRMLRKCWVCYWEVVIDVNV